MHPKALTVTEIVRNFSDYISRVAYQRESFVLFKGKRPMAELRPLPTAKELGELPRLLESIPHLTKSEADAFARDLSLERERLANEGVRNPWDS